MLSLQLDGLAPEIVLPFACFLGQRAALKLRCQTSEDNVPAELFMYLDWDILVCIHSAFQRREISVCGHVDRIELDLQGAIEVLVQHLVHIGEGGLGDPRKLLGPPRLRFRVRLADLVGVGFPRL